MDLENILIGIVIIIAVLIIFRFRPRKRHEEPTAGPAVVEPARPSHTIELVTSEPDSAATEAELRQRLLGATTAQQCTDLYTDVPSDHPIAKDVYHRFVAFARNELNTAESLEECATLTDLLGEFEGEEINALWSLHDDKRLSLVTTTDEAMSFYDEYDGDDEDFNDKILAKALELAETADEAGSVYDEADRDSELEQQAMARKIELTETVQACQKIWDDCGIESDFGQLAILRAAEIIQSESDDEAEAEDEDVDDDEAA